MCTFKLIPVKLKRDSLVKKNRCVRYKYIYVWLLKAFCAQPLILHQLLPQGASVSHGLTSGLWGHAMKKSISDIELKSDFGGTVSLIIQILK